VAFEGHDPDILESRPYTTVDAVMDAHAEAAVAGLSREATIEHMANALRGAKPASGGRQPAGGGPRGGAEGPVIEAKAERGWLGRE
jgi:hypothetical protein